MITLHSFRVTAASRALARCQSLHAVQRFGRWRTLAVVLRYTASQREEQDISDVVGVLFGGANTASTSTTPGASRQVQAVAGLDDEELQCLAAHAHGANAQAPSKDAANDIVESFVCGACEHSFPLLTRLNDHIKHRVAKAKDELHFRFLTGAYLSTYKKLPRGCTDSDWFKTAKAKYGSNI